MKLNCKCGNKRMIGLNQALCFKCWAKRKAKKQKMKITNPSGLLLPREHQIEESLIFGNL